MRMKTKHCARRWKIFILVKECYQPPLMMGKLKFPRALVHFNTSVNLRRTRGHHGDISVLISVFRSVRVAAIFASCIYRTFSKQT